MTEATTTLTRAGTLARLGQTDMNICNKADKRHHSNFLHWLWVPISATALYYYLWIWNPLPSDEQMIENFKVHRADFVELVRRYREYPRPPEKDTSFWYMEGDTLEVFKRAGIDNIDLSAPIWLPNPYSIETARRELDLLPEELHKALYLYSALRIQPATTPLIDHPKWVDHRRHYRNTLLFGVIWKDYQVFPEIPRIENGKLLGPLQIVGKAFPGAQFHEGEGVATSQSKHRVFPSLNHLPSDWKSFECVYRPIEPQWYIRMCNGRY